MKLDRDRLQGILDEAGRTDIQIPDSVDGATIGIHVPAGIMALYGNCGDMAADLEGKPGNSGGPGQQPDPSCVSLIELRSPTLSAPPQIDPAQIAQVALQFLGMNANDAASFTQTVDWTTTMVLPVVQGETNYKRVQIGDNEAVLLRPRYAQPANRYSLLWINQGIVYCVTGAGDDRAAINLGEQLN